MQGNLNVLRQTQLQVIELENHVSFSNLPDTGEDQLSWVFLLLAIFQRK